MFDFCSMMEPDGEYATDFPYGYYVHDFSLLSASFSMLRATSCTWQLSMVNLTVLGRLKMSISGVGTTRALRRVLRAEEGLLVLLIGINGDVLYLTV